MQWNRNKAEHKVGVKEANIELISGTMGLVQQ